MILKRLSILAVHVLPFGAGAVWAKERVVCPWSLSATGSLSVADGNSESLAYSLQLLGEYEGELYDARLGLDHFFAENDTVESSNSTKFHEQLSRDLDEHWYLSHYGSVLTDAVADIDYRIDTSIMLGRHLLQEEKATLSLEFGPGYAWERKGKMSEQYMTARLSQRFEYLFSREVKLWQSLSWTPRVEDAADSVYELELGLENKLNSSLSLRTFIRHRVDTAPALAQGRSDTALLVGLHYSFSGEQDLPSPGSDVSNAVLGTGLATDDAWESTAALGLTFNRGNADKTGFKLNWASEYTGEERELSWEFAYHFAEDAGQTSTDRLHSRLQLNRELRDPLYLGMAAGFLRDDLADIGYRFTPSALLGRKLVEQERTRLDLEIGPMMSFEQTGNGYGQYPSLRLVERLRHRFSNKLRLRQSIEATSALDEPERYVLASKLALETKLNCHLSWRWELESRYENLPVNGRAHHDLLFTSGVALNF